MAAATGSLLGGAWGTAFVDGELHTAHPTATLLRSRDTVSLLLESRSRRLLVIDHRGEASVGTADDVTATLLGLLRRRVDIALVSTSMLESLGSAWSEAWRVRMVAPLTATSAHPFADRVVALGDLRVTLHQWPSEASRANDEGTEPTWTLTARNGAVALVCGASWPAVTAAPRWPETTLTVATAVGEVEEEGSSVRGDILIVPSEEVGPDLVASVQARGSRIVRLYRDDPLTVELHADGVRLPGGDI